ncbi:phosphoenolpyruvate synthase [Pararhodobacter oceanensis]|uniref:Phosphoenolpyruvate synthase n=1 Tax=Pararhodobacter oceanensis TaxID=2172121 RepID=A0A2T8HQY0_9RHOB|nr:phosphoenolpyruvate synthase [Pararhodobacter oceanensis]PVH27844.1 phosphoenolpyruvate synthase [Pararhodobacter oceanensis]
MSDYVLPFARIDHSALAEVGGKGANLGEMARAGFPVPDGFCVTTRAYRAYVAPVEAQVYAMLEGLDPADLSALRRAGQQVRDLLAQQPLPEEVVQALTEAWQDWPPDQAFAVRSSATAEDLPTASFAGQQDTYLNVIGLQALTEQTRQCFISLFTDRAVLYRMQNGFAHAQVALSVVVQQMVLPELSGILFTADPISENRHVTSIDASFGLGEALVSGLVSADLYKVDKRSGAIVSREIARKKLAILPLAEGGTEQVDLPEAQQTAAALSDTQITALSALGAQIEGHYGQPQDIEWAIAGGEIFITQSRPITSLYPMPQIALDDDSLHVFLSLSHLQVMTDAMPPMAISLWRYFPSIGLNAQGESRYAQDIGGRVYADLSPILRHPLGRRILTTFMGVADQLAQAALKEQVQRPEFLAQGERYNPLRLVFLLRHYARRIPWFIFFGKTAGEVAKVDGLMRDYVDQVALDLRAPDLDPAQRFERALAALRGLPPAFGAWAPQMVAGILSQRWLHRLAGAQNADLVADIERGVVGNVVTDMNLAIGDLADAARGSEEVFAHLSRVPEGVSLDGVAQVAGGPEFLAKWQAFLQRYGARGPSEIDISRPRWHEDSGSLLQMVLGMTQHSEAGAHRRHYDALTEAGLRAAQALPARVPWYKRALVRRLTGNSRDLMPLREHHKFMMIMVLDEVKTVLLEIAADLSQRGVLAQPEDIWFLQAGDLRDALAGPTADLRALVSQRRADFAHYARKAPPRVITSEGEHPRPNLVVEGAPDGAMIGSAVSSGIYEGIARVVRDPGRETLAPGEILVAPFTDPGWTPLFVNASALVTEVGGLMTHGSVVAREYGIPAVVGVPEATALIKTGDRLRINGDAGYVEILP